MAKKKNKVANLHNKKLRDCKFHYNDKKTSNEKKNKTTITIMCQRIFYYIQDYLSSDKYSEEDILKISCHVADMIEYNLNKLEDPSGDYELNGNSQRITLYNRINFPEKYIKLY